MQEYIISLVLVLLAYYAIKNVFSGSETLEGFVSLLAIPVSLYCITGPYFYVGFKMGLPDWVGGLFFFPCAYVAAKIWGFLIPHNQEKEDRILSDRNDHNN